jgi:uncharacterized membrane protein YqjE
MLERDLYIPEQPSTGLFDSLRNLLATLAQIGHTRLELLGTEVEEQVVRLVSTLIWGLVALFLAFATTVLAAVAIIVAFWDSNRIMAAVGVAVVFGIAAAVAAWRALTQLHNRPHLFQATLEELKKDRERLVHR